MPDGLFWDCDLRDHAGAHLLSYRVSGGRGVGLCPLHADTRPSLTITRRSWHCYGCRAEGGILDFFIRIAGMSKPEAIRFVKSLGSDSSPSGEVGSQLDSSHLEARVQAAQAGLECALPYLSARGIEKGIATEWNLGALNGRLIIPYYDADGLLQGTAERALNGQSRKYSFSTGMRKSQLLFGLNRVRDDERLVLCEGFFDCITLNVAGIPAVALGGVDLSEEQIELLRGREIIVSMDGDNAGRQASAKITEQFSSAGIGSIIADPGDSLDPDERTRQDGNADWIEFWREFPPAPEPSQPSTVVDRPSVADVISAPALMARTFEHRPYIISRFWPHGGQGIIAAQFGSYKTAFLQTLARDLARGHSILPGWKVERPYRVLYVDFELPLPHIQQRFSGVLGNTEPPKNLHWLTADSLLPYGGMDLGSGDGKAAFMEVLTDLAPDVVIVETIIGAFSSHNPAFEASDAQEFTRFVSDLRLLGFACLWSAHTPKTEGPGLAYGSNFQNTGMDFILGLNRGAEQGMFDLKFLKQRWEPVDAPDVRVEIRFEPSGTELIGHGHGQDPLGDLLRLIHEREPRTQSALADFMGKSESMASRRCRDLRRRGLLQGDSLTLTPKGYLCAGIYRSEEN